MYLFKYTSSQVCKGQLNIFKNMSRQLFISLMLISCLSCSIHYDKQNDCTYKVKKVLNEASKYIKMNKETKVYTLLSTKLPEFDRTMYKYKIDSLGNLFLIPPTDNMIKRLIYSQQLKSFLNLGCTVTIEDIRSYFGSESQSGTKNNIIHSMYYWFNGVEDNDCFSKYAEFGPFNTCSLLSFDIDENQNLKDVRIDHFF